MKRKTGDTIKQRYGEDFFQKIGAKGGKVKVTKGFGAATPEQRREWGRKGGSRKARVQNESEISSTAQEVGGHLV
jgi:general stress protein YciG